MIMIAPLLDRNLFVKNIVDSIKLSIHLFQGGMKDSGSESVESGDWMVHLQ